MSPRRAISLFWGPSGLQGCHTCLCEVDLWPPATFPLHPAQLASASSIWMLLDTLTTQLDLGEAAVLKVSQWSLERNSFLLCPCGVSPLWNGLKKKRKRSKLYRQSYGDWEKLVQLHKELKRTLKKKKNTEIQRPFLVIQERFREGVEPDMNLAADSGCPTAQSLVNPSGYTHLKCVLHSKSFSCLCEIVFISRFM